jgi:hypothetical protein
MKKIGQTLRFLAKCLQKNSCCDWPEALQKGEIIARKELPRHLSNLSFLFTRIHRRDMTITL